MSDDTTSKETLDRELSPPLSIKDAYPKALVARTRHEAHMIEGIPIVDSARGLLGERNSL